MPDDLLAAPTASMPPPAALPPAEGLPASPTPRRGGAAGAPPRVATRDSRNLPPVARYGFNPIDNTPVPAHPGTFVGPASTPRAPYVVGDGSDVERADQLARTYRAAQRADGFESHAFRRGAIQNSKHYRLLVKAAAILLREAVAPADWISWSLHIWRRYNPERGPAPVTWVFSANRLEERMDWFRHDWVSLGCVVTSGKEYRALLEDYLRMTIDLRWAAIRRGRSLTDAEKTGVVASHFPPGEFAKRLDRSRQEGERIQQVLHARVAAGDWVW